MDFPAIVQCQRWGTTEVTGRQFFVKDSNVAADIPMFTKRKDYINKMQVLSLIITAAKLQIFHIYCLYVVYILQYINIYCFRVTHELTQKVTYNVLSAIHRVFIQKYEIYVVPYNEIEE